MCMVCVAMVQGSISLEAHPSNRRDVIVVMISFSQIVDPVRSVRVGYRKDDVASRFSYCSTASDCSTGAGGKEK